jgi:hypothetical protein
MRYNMQFRGLTKTGDILLKLWIIPSSLVILKSIFHPSTFKDE